MAFSNICSLVSGISQRIVTVPVDVHWNCPMDFSGIFKSKFTSVLSGV